MDTADSDVDTIGVFQAPLTDILSMGWSRDNESQVGKDPDFAYHEIGKFCRLAASNNPTILEVLWLNNYEILDWRGQALVDARTAFLSRRCRSTYGGYAKQQMTKLLNKGFYSSTLRNRTAKHSRHLLRLLIQGEELLRTGCLTVRLTPDQVDYVRQDRTIEQLTREFDRMIAKMDSRVDTSPLPDEPDVGQVNDILFNIRVDGIRWPG